ncbi:MAG: TVP38/TMEM64 family protein [Pseudomonadota bacterium]
MAEAVHFEDQHRPEETEMSDAKAEKSGGSRLKRFLPLIGLGGLAATGIYYFGDALSFEALRDNREALIAWRDANIVVAALTFTALYAAVTALSIPGALWMTLLGGFLFGAVVATPLIVVGATVGATIIFIVARTSLGETLRATAGPWLKKLEAGFQENAWSYMLILRLVPAAPFFIVNIAPALLGARLGTFVWTTALGIIPGVAVFASVGAGLGEVIARGEQPDLGLIFEPHVLGPLLGLAALSALPVILKAFRKSDPAQEDAADKPAG